MASGKKVYPFETKVAVAQRFLAGEPKTDLAIEFGLSSPRSSRDGEGSCASRAKTVSDPDHEVGRRPRGRPTRSKLCGARLSG